MGEWILRTQTSQDWISLFFLVNTMLFVAMYIIDAYRVKALFRLFSSQLILSKHLNEKNYNYFSAFNLLSFILIGNALGLLCLWLLQYNNSIPYFAFEFYYLLLGLFLWFIIRYFILKFILNQLKIYNKIRVFLFNNFNQNSQFAVYFLILLFLRHFSSFPVGLLDFAIIGFILLWSLFQFRSIVLFFTSAPEDIFYLILYLCAFKIAPWLWYYKIFIETKL